MSVKSSTWHRESHGLYDYESSNITNKKIKVTSDTFLLLTSDKLLSVQKNTEIEVTSESKFLTAFSRNGSGFTIDVNKYAFQGKGYPFEHTWLVLKNIKGSNGYALSEGDIIRLGKVQLKIKEIKGPRKSKVTKPVIHSKNIFSGGIGGVHKLKPDLASPLQVKILDGSNEIYSCRICLTEDSSKENPLITPCTCSGSMGWVHLECLQRWLSSKVATRDHNNSTSYSWKSLECELCKFKFPDRIQLKNNVYELLSVKKPENNYIVLESMNQGGNTTKTINVISFQDKKNIRLGRGHDSDIRLPDISVSRNHANIKLTSGGLFLDDVSSKFGTLVRIKKPILMDPGSKIQIQSGRTLMQIGVKKPFSFFSCLGVCNRHRDSDEDISRHIRDVTEESISQQVDHST